MNVLMLTHRLPYAPNRGDRLRAYHLLRLLGTRYEVHVVSLVHDEEEASRASNMTDLASSIAIARRARAASMVRGAIALAGPRPLTHVLLDAPALQRTIEGVVARVRPEVVLAYGSGLARCALRPPLGETPFVLDLVDVDSQKWRSYADRTWPPLRWVYLREATRLGEFEARAAQSAFATLVVNQRELGALEALAPHANGMIVPNGIDLQYLKSPRPPARQERVLFCGVMDYRPNAEGAAWFLTDVWPRVRAARPAATLCIAGTSPSAAIRGLARAAGAVEVTGHVEDVRPCYWDAAVFVAPLHLARGVQNKVLAAAAASLPSVVTSAVRDGLPKSLALSCVVADDAEGFAAAVVDLLGRSPEERRALGSTVDLDALSWPKQLAAVPDLLEAAARSMVPRRGSKIPMVASEPRRRLQA